MPLASPLYTFTREPHFDSNDGISPPHRTLAMAPARSPSQPSSSQSKKQQSISSFFTPKPSSTPKPTPTSKPPVSLKNPTPINGSKDSESVPSSDEEIVLPQRRAPPRKRILDEAGGNASNELPDPKKSKKSTINSNTKLQDAGNDEAMSIDNSAKDDGSISPTPPPSHYSPLGQASTAAVTAVKHLKVSERTARYLFSSSPIEDENQDESDFEEARRQKERLHQRFVKKLGKPDSIAEIKRRNKFISEETAGGENGAEGDEAEEDEPVSKPTAKGKKGAAAKKGGGKLTPMDKQYLEIKRKHLDALIIMEVGYKFKLLGEDARIASKELGIVCIPGKFRYDERKLDNMKLFCNRNIPFGVY